MTPKEHQFAPFRLDAENQCLWRGSEQISLSPKAFSVLLYMVERPGRLITKQELLDAVWPDIHVTEGVLKRAVLEIRKALGDPVEEPRFIQTLHRRGYRFLPATAERRPAAEQAPAGTGVVGRVREFRQLDAWFEDAMESSRQMVFISGEAGLGKTTLVDTWMRTLRPRGPAADRGSVALGRGRCLQQFGSGEPYLPVFEALDQLSQALGHRLVEHLRARAPTWLMHMPALISLEDRAKLRDEVFGSTRERMLREITDALETLSEETPLVIALEDLHWSDPSTIDLLSSIARRTSPARLMILGTYRPADAGGGSSHLLDAQNELQLHRQCQVLPLTYLSEAATGEYLSMRFAGMESVGDFALALHERTNGNPLYIVCLVDELERSGRIGSDPAAIREIVPETLQQMFERQAAQLEPAAQEMLDAGAVAGESFSIASIAAALGWERTHVESLCERMVRRHAILKRSGTVRFPDGTESAGYSFLHALCRDALYRKIPYGRRSRLHGQLGQADEQLYAADPKRIAAELAGHFELARDFPRAIQYLRTAADGAVARLSIQEAARYVDRAFEMVERLRDAADQASRRMDLLEQRAWMRLSASDAAGAADDFKALAEHARMAGSPDRQARALLDSVPPLTFIDYRQALAALDEAQASQSAKPDPTLGAVIDVYRAYFGMYLYGWNREYADLLERAAPKVRSSPDLRVRSRNAWMESAAHAFAAEYRVACERAEESRQHSRKAGVSYDYFVATLFLNWAHLHRGDLGQAMRVCREAAELAARNGSRLSLLWLTLRQAWVQMEAFDFENALPVCERIAADPTLPSNRHMYPAYLWLGMARIGHHDYDGAWEALEKLRLAIEEGGQAFRLLCPLLQAQTECSIGRKDLIRARTLAGRLVEVATKHHESSYEARGHRLLAEMAILARDWLSAAEYVSKALAALERCEAWNVEWRVHAAASHVFFYLGRHRQSDEARERSLEVARRVADTLVDEPALQKTFLNRVAAELEVRASWA